MAADGVKNSKLNFALRNLAEGVFHSILILPDDHAQPSYETTPGFKPFIILC